MLPLPFALLWIGVDYNVAFFFLLTSCGDVMKLQIRVDDEGIISDVKFKTFGCGSAIASSSYMTERVKGLSLDEAGKIKNTEIAKELSLPPVKLHCSSVYIYRFPPFHLVDTVITRSAGRRRHSLCYQRLSIEAVSAPGNEAEEFY
jgi:NifU-like N terminal domain